IAVGILESYVPGKNENTVFTPALIGALAGIITEFIGATFLFIYRSTVQQAANYMKTLERINSVGMATKILDTISNKSQEL
ncbi:MAG: TRADD-N-associated membrane domain-containing protein, partial [Ktedonobacteraceae bacterium]